MTRTYPRITLDPVVPSRLVGSIGLCEAWCGAEREIAGLLNGEPLCVVCHKESAEREFMIISSGDVMCSQLPTLASAMAEVATYLEDPDQWRRYFPVSIYAENQAFNLEDLVAKISMPT